MTPEELAQWLEDTQSRNECKLHPDHENNAWLLTAKELQKKRHIEVFDAYCRTDLKWESLLKEENPRMIHYVKLAMKDLADELQNDIKSHFKEEK